MNVRKNQIAWQSTTSFIGAGEEVYVLVFWFKNSILRNAGLWRGSSLVMRAVMGDYVVPHRLFDSYLRRESGFGSLTDSVAC